MEFSVYLKSCREANDITQDELVVKLYNFNQEVFKNLDAGTISRWERHATIPNTQKKLSIIKFFQQFSSDPFPYLDTYTEDQIESLICKSNVDSLISKNKHFVLNFPSEAMNVDDMKVYPIRSIEDASLLFAINMDLHNATNIDECTKISLSQFEEWSMHPGNLFLACEYKSRLVGLFFSVRVKHEVFEKLMNFEMKKSEITDADFADVDEVGSNVLLSFYAVNVKVATMLFIRHYAYLIANQKIIEEVGVITSVSEVKKTLSNMNLKLYKNRLLENSVNVETYREKLKYVLASEYVVKMIFSK